MALYFNTSSDKLERLPSPNNGAPQTFAGWIRRVNTAVAHTILCASADAVDTNGFRIEVTSAGVARAVQKSAGTPSSATAGTIADTIWHHVTGIYPTNSSRTAYLDGTPGTANTVARAAVTEDRILVGANYVASALTQNTGMELAEVAAWQAILDDAEIAALAKGVSPLLIRPQSLSFYTPLKSSEQDLKDNTAWGTVTHSGVVAHPRIFMPAAPRIIGVAAASGTPAGTALETDTSPGVGLAMSAGPAAGTNAALALAISLGIGIAAATNTALARGMALGFSPANENEAALAPALRLGISPALETDAAIRGGAAITPSLETDAALARAIALGISPATSNSAGFALVIRLGVTPALESNSAIVASIGPTAPAPVGRTRAVTRSGRSGSSGRAPRTAMVSRARRAG